MSHLLVEYYQLSISVDSNQLESVIDYRLDQYCLESTGAVFVE
jgi:hypothetical protein